jgi:hypothetical protein
VKKKSDMQKLEIGDKISIDEETVLICKDFIKKRHKKPDSFWSARADEQTPEYKIVNDHFIGKKGEFALYNLLIRKGYKCSLPDVKVYKIQERSFKEDLIVYHPNGCEMLLHIKTMRADDVSKYGISYMFTKGDPLIDTPMDNEFIGMMIAHNNGTTFELVNILPAQDVFPEFSDLPKAEYKRRSFVAIYYENIFKTLRNRYRSALKYVI